MSDHAHLIKVILAFWRNRQDKACFISYLKDNLHLEPSTEVEKMEEVQQGFNDALNFAIDKADGAQDAMDFLVAWREGDWGTLDEHYPEFDLSDRLRKAQL